MINNIIKVVLLLIACLLAYLLYNSIMGEIEYRKEVRYVEGLVKDKLDKIRTAELAYKDIHGGFTSDFDTLIKFVKTGKLQILVEYGEKDDSSSVFRQEIKEVSVQDSLFKNYNFDSIAFVPPMDTAQFELLSSRVIQGNVEVPVFQVTDPWPFDRQRSNPNHPKPPLRVGSISEARYSGNWK